jgi:signal transduction histidine kinase
MKILIVDDNTENLEVMKIILNYNNYSVVSANNGKIALEILRSDKFELIISDILMPVMDGFLFCKECKHDVDLAKIPFVFYTATYIDTLDKEFALSLGAQEFITKPQEPENFLKIIDNVIQKTSKEKLFVNDSIETNENEILKLYSERLISKLEKKNIDLEQEIAAHKITLADLQVAKEKAEESDKLKTAFLQNISHEIRTPLNGILGFSDLLKSESISQDDIKEFTSIISRCGHRLLDIINNVLDISKIETGQIKIIHKPFSLNLLMNDLFVFFTPLNKKKGLNYTYTSTLDNLNCYVMSDETKLNQILSNLVNNSIKFTTSGSISYGYEIVDEKIQFYVKDTGIGISPENQGKIFDRFSQIDIKNANGLSGAGLGLAICKGLVEMLGGNIWVESEINKGTTIFFTIPYLPDNIDILANHDLIFENNSTKNIKVLIAEDDYTSYALLKRVLTDDRYIIIHAENGLQAVELVKNNPDIDLVLMDIRMPIMDGIEATKRIKLIRPNLPIIAQTAYAFSEEKENILSVGCNDCLAKPIEQSLLLKLIDLYI